MPSPTARTVLWVATRGYRRANCLAKDGFLSPMRALDNLKRKTAVVSPSQAPARDWKLGFVVGFQLSQLKAVEVGGRWRRIAIPHRSFFLRCCVVLRVAAADFFGPALDDFNRFHRDIWLILPVVICLSQRLSHACLSTNRFKVKPRMAH